MFRGHTWIKLRRASVIAVPRSHPTNAALAGFLDGEFRGSLHNQMPQSVVAVDECRPRSVAHYVDVRPCIDRPVLDLLHILRQPEYAMRIAAARVGFCHQRGHLSR